MANVFEMDLWEYGARALAARAGHDPDELIHGVPAWCLYERDAQCVIDAIFDRRQAQRTPSVERGQSRAMSTQRNKEIIEKFRSGVRVVDIAAEYGIGRARIYHIIGPIRGGDAVNS